MNEFLDMHAHAYLWPCPPQSGTGRFSSPDELLKRHDDLGVGRAVLHPLIGPEIYLPQSNEEILEICRLHPGRFIPFCNIDPRAIGNRADADFTPWLRWYKEHGCKGVGELTANLNFLDPFVQNLFRQVEDAGLPLTFHVSPAVGESYGLVDHAGLPQLEICLQRFPRLKFFGHSQAFWAEIGAMKNPASDRRGYPKYPVEEEGRTPQLMRKYPNLYGDLSAGSGANALTRDRAFGAAFLNEFQDRLFFGLDICAPNTPAPLAAHLLDLRAAGDISEAVFRKVARENAIRVLGL